MPANHYEGFAPQFASVYVVKPSQKLTSDIHEGNVTKTVFSQPPNSSMSNPVLDRVSKTKVNNTSSADRHYTVAARGITSAYLPKEHSEHKNLRRLCQHSPFDTKVENGTSTEWAWYQVQVTSRAAK